MATVFDLDGVIWRGDTALPGAAVAVSRLRASGVDVVFVTNNSSEPPQTYLAKLARMGIPTPPDRLLSSAMAAALLVEAGETVLACAGEGVIQALEERKAVVVDKGPADTVIVGWHRQFDFARLTAAVQAVLGGARLIGTNDDATYPAAEGVLPGAGSILAAVAYGSGATPRVAGKPHPPMATLLRAAVGSTEMVVGDRPSTDGLLASRLGAPFALVRTGITPPGADPGEPKPTWDALDLPSLVDEILGHASH